MGRPSKYAPELRERAVRMVQEHASEYPSQWAAVRSVAEKLGCSTEALRRWLRQAERESRRKVPYMSADGRRITFAASARRASRVDSIVVLRSE